MALVLKIGGLFIKAIGKPIANSLKYSAKQNDLFKKIAISAGRGVNQASTRLSLFTSYGKVQNITVKPLSEKQAVERGAEVLGKLLLLYVLINKK